jgi:glycosyltransferase involved in cell wall biosynthesis
MRALPISVIIPHYNRPHFLEEALTSIQTQTVPPAEIIVVDDHSALEAQSRLRGFKDIARIHRNATNLGVSESRNIGVELARNDWVAFLDDDDLYDSRKLELQSAYLRRHPNCEVLGGPLLHVTPDGTADIWGYREPRQLQLRDALLYTASSMCTMLIHKSAYRRAGCMDGTFRHLGDLEFGIRLLAAGCHMEILPEPLVIYRHGGREELSLQWQETCRSHFRAIHKHRKLYRQEFGSLGAIQEYARRARFYGLRKGRLLGRSMWAVGCVMQKMVGNARGLETVEAPLAAPRAVSVTRDSGWCALDEQESSESATADIAKMSEV